MNAYVLTTKVADGKRIYFDAEMGDALTEALEGLGATPAFV
jgi:hypothetical protein